MHLDTLMGELKTAHLDTGEPIIPPQPPAGWPVEAGIIPAVLDGNSQVLDLGRKPNATPTKPNASSSPIDTAAAKSRAATSDPAPTSTTRNAGSTEAHQRNDLA